MDGITALRRMVKHSGLSGRQVSKDMGKSVNYISSALGQGSDPTAGTLADVAAVCGYTLQLVGHGETLTLDGRPDGQGPGREGQ